MADQVRIRTEKAAIALEPDEARELARRVRPFSAEAAASIEAADGSVVTFTRGQKQHVYDVVNHLLNGVGADRLGPRLVALREAVADDLARPANS
jgi:hypothetical protein